MKSISLDSAFFQSRTAMFLVVGFACIARLWGTWYGLPFSYYEDEYHEVMRALQLGMGGFNFERTGKGGFYFLLFFEYGIYYVLLKLGGVVNSTREYAEMFVRDPSAFYLMGRVTAALIGGATVAAAIWVGRRAFGPATGLLAGLLLAINLLHIDLSRLIGVDVPMGLLAAITIYFGLRVAEGGRRRDYLLSALFAALATTTKLPGILLLLPLAVAHGYSVANAGGKVRDWFGSRELWLAVVVFALVYVSTNPGILVHSGYLSLFTGSPAESAGDAPVEALGAARPNLFVFYLMAIRESMGWPLFGLALVSVGYAFWKRTAADVILLSYALVNYIAISSTTSDTLYYPRYTLPIILVLSILAGRALAKLVEATNFRLVAALVVACFVAAPLSASISTAVELTQPDSRTLAREWIVTHVPAGSRVLIEGLKIGPVRSTVQLHETPEAIARRAEYWRTAEPKQARFLELQLGAHQGGGYELELMQSASALSLDAYLSRGIEYFVVRPDVLMTARRADTSSRELMRDLRGDARVRLLRRFEGSGRIQFGPTIEVYGPTGKRHDDGG